MSRRSLVVLLLLSASLVFSASVDVSAEEPVELAEVPVRYLEELMGESSKASPVDEHNQVHQDLTRSGLLGGKKSHSIDYRSNADVDDELAESLVVDYQMDNTLYPTMDHTGTPYAKNAPPLEYVGLPEEERDAESGEFGWVRSLDTRSSVNASGFAFEKGQGFWLDFSRWHQDAMPSTTYTIDVLFKLDEVSGMRRIFSKDKDSEEGMYVFDDKIVFWPHILHTNPDSFKTALVQAGEWVRVTLVRDGADNDIRGYVNGEISWQLEDPLGSAVLPKTGRLNLFQDDQGYSSAGVLGRVRVYSRALDDRHVKLMGRHAVDAVYPNYTYGRRIYRNLVIADYQFQNSLLSSVFTEYPLFVNNRTFIDPVYVLDGIEAAPPKVVLEVPAAGLTYAIDQTARIHNFDGEEFTISALVKVPHAPDRFQNLLSWTNEHSEISLRVLNSQLILATRDRGEDLHDTARKLFSKRQKGAAEVGERQSDYLQSSQNEFLRLRLERRQARIQEAQLNEARIREVEIAKAERAGELPRGQKASGPAPETYSQIRADERALRVASGLEPANAPEPLRVLTPEQYAAKQYQWELEQATANEADRKRGPTTLLALSPERAERARRASLEAQIKAGRRVAGGSGIKAVVVDRSGYGPAGPPEEGDDEEGGSSSSSEDEGLADLLYVDRESNSERSRDDVWEQEIKAHLPKTSTQEVDKQISECFMRGGKWRFAPVDKCSLDVEHGDLDEAPRAYDEVFDLASSVTDSVKADKWVAVTITRSLEGTVQCYVNGRRALQYFDRNTTNTAIGGDRFSIFTPDAVAPANIPDLRIGRLVVYDQNLRSTEIREMVRGTKWSPTKAINIDRKTGNISPQGAKETVQNCISFLPIWNARSTAPGAEHGATMLWVRNACKTSYVMEGTLCGERFTCKAQSRGWMSCGTIVDTYCMVVKDVKTAKDAF
jgi:hypothetical protein